MQFFGISSLLLCVVCMFFLFNGETKFARYIFQSSLVLLIISLTLSVLEVQISTNALSIELSDLEEAKHRKNRENELNLK